MLDFTFCSSWKLAGKLLDCEGQGQNIDPRFRAFKRTAGFLPIACTLAKQGAQKGVLDTPDVVKAFEPDLELQPFIDLGIATR